MCDFKPGDEVVCIAMQCAPEMVGNVYIVEVFARPGEKPPGAWCRLDAPGVQLVGVKTDDGPHTGLWGWDANCFRKVQRRDLGAWLQTAATDTDHLDKPIKTPARPEVDALLQRVQSGAFG